MTASYLTGSDQPLTAAYDVALLDLDGVVYVGPSAVPAAPAALAQARRDGMRLAFVTNNAARPAGAVADLLTSLGVPAEVDEVITSAQTAAHYLARRLPAGANVLVVGGAGLYEALRERGLSPVASADDGPQAVVQGFSPDTNWQLLSEGAVAIRRGVFWLATNLDSTVPSARGPLPGNGSLVAALRHATGAEPVATGKPDPTMHAETVERTGAQRPIVVGDRLDTDIEGARRVGCASLLVFSGVTTPADLLAARADQRPDYVADDVAGLLEPHPPVSVSGERAHCGRWTARLDGSTIELTAASASAAGTGTSPDGSGSSPDGSGSSPDGSGSSPDGAGFGADALDALRAACVLSWTSASTTVTVHPGDDAARAVLSTLRLAS